MTQFNPKAINRNLIACFDIDTAKLPARYRRKRDSHRSLLAVYLECKRHVRQAHIALENAKREAAAREARIERYANCVANDMPIAYE